MTCPGILTDESTPQSRVADIESLRHATTKLDEMLTKHGIDEDEIVREFQRLRRGERHTL